MKFFQNNKGIVSAVIVFLLVIWLYKSFFAPDDLLVDDAANNPAIGADVLELNNSIQSVNLDPSLFSSAAYRGLVDFTTTLLPQSKGRKNPFNPIGVDASGPTSITGTSTAR